MSVSVTMPALGESVTEGTVTRWLKKVGDTVAADEPLLEVSTDKVDTEIPSPAAGVLLSITVDEDAVVEVGAELAVIGEASEATNNAAAPAAPEPAATPPAPPAEAERAVQAPPQPEPVTAAPTSAPPGESTVPESTQAEFTPAETTPLSHAAETTPAETTPYGASAAAASGEQTAVVLPAFGESVTEGTVTRWLKNVGDVVAADEALLEVSTDKVDTEIPAPVAGVLLSIDAPEDTTIEVGGTLGVIGAGGSAPAPAPAQAPAAPATAPAAAAPSPLPPAPATPPATPPVSAPRPIPAPAAAIVDAPAATSTGSLPADIYVTPLVRKLAAQNSIDLGTVAGTGVGGRIRKQDVLDAVEAAKSSGSAPAAGSPSSRAASPASASPAAGVPSPLRGKTEKLSRLRKVIAERMVESLHVSAQLTTVVEVDVTKVAVLRDRAKKDFEAREGVKLSFLPFFAKAALEALKTHPNVNATIDTEAGTVTYYDIENLGVAVDTERGLLVPVIREAGDLSVAGLAKKIADLADRTRDNGITPDELSGGTFTLTNTGSRGALFDTPIINQPQVAILGTGAVVKRPTVVLDEFNRESIAVRSIVYLALTYDHRLVDGADAARFLGSVKSRLEDGDFEAELGI